MMERKALAAAAANYPYLQGLWAIPFGIGMVVAGVSNLQHRPSGPVLLGVFGGGLALCAVAALLITRHYRGNYGTVTPTRSRHVRHGVAIVAWAVVLFVGANRYLLWSPDSAVCIRGRVRRGHPRLLCGPCGAAHSPPGDLGSGVRGGAPAGLGSTGRGPRRGRHVSARRRAHRLRPVRPAAPRTQLPVPAPGGQQPGGQQPWRVTTNCWSTD